MPEDLNQKISQLLDNELGRDDALILLKKMKLNPDLKSKQSRYEMISHALKAEFILVPDPGFSVRVSEAIRQEPTYLLPQTKQKRTRKMLAAAASVAVLAVIAGKGIEQRNNTIQTASVLQTPASTSSPPIEVARKPDQDPVNQRINEYLQAHNSSVYTNGQPNFQPYARVTAYGQR